MYESFFGLNEKPFSLLPDPGFFYLSKIHQEALTLVEYGLYNQSGFTVLTGEIGSGKTTLMRYLLDRLDQDLTVGLISHTHQSLGQIMDWVCVAFDIKVQAGDRIAQHQAFVDFLLDEYRKGKKTLLIIDEAQNLGLDKLEEIRLLSNINADKDLVLQLLLLGQPQLRQQLRQPELEQFVQRVSASYHLGRLNAEETFYYIRHRLKIAGGQKTIFTPDACHAVFHYSNGIPRIINLICETALVYAYGAGTKTITGKAIDQFIRSDSSHLLFAIEGEERPPRPEYKGTLPDVTDIDSENGEAESDARAREDEATVATARQDPPPHSEATQPPARAEPATTISAIAPAPVAAFDATRPVERLDVDANVAPRLHTESELVAANASPDTRDRSHPADGDSRDVSIAKLIESAGISRRWTAEIVAVAAGLLMGAGLVGWYIQHQDSRPSQIEDDRQKAEPIAGTMTPTTPEPSPAAVEPPESPPTAEQGKDAIPLEAGMAANEGEPSDPGAMPSSVPESESSDPASSLDTGTDPRVAMGPSEGLENAGREPSTEGLGVLSRNEPPSSETGQVEPESEARNSGDSPAGEPDGADRLNDIERRLTDLSVSVERLGTGQLRVDFSRLIQFPDGSTELDTAARTLLDQFATILADNDRFRARVIAHTDSKGSRANNQALSAKRAAAVAGFIERDGVPGSRINHEGKGEDEMKLTPEKEKELGPWINRRIEIDLIETP
ncbi:AAA family ATPase [Thiocystis violacea]|uniref:AAA family ATPase n=1 Tax=Thiocystis violacea TaxID=13725 RepID=UPI001906E018|nr:AAA family ATPase [Thiocystis violacea]MBK1719923.1 hypothetical protein [Thiocystis violacea]